MKFKTIIPCLLLFTTPLFSFAQDSTFNIEFPTGWIQFQRDDVLNSVKSKFALSDKMKEEILANTKSKQLLGYAAPAKAGALYRPNIQVLLIKNGGQNFAQFKASIQNSLGAFKNQIGDFKIIDSVSEVVIGGRKAVYAKITGYLPTKTGEKATLISRIYAVPAEKYFYQVTMNDSADYDCEADFKTVLASLKL
ncbi:MAG: hypothetical protein V4725_14275 [Bacteroidota bacterium]|nr:hypothetical protein [Ferruginibacter sp.]